MNSFSLRVCPRKDARFGDVKFKIDTMENHWGRFVRDLKFTKFDSVTIDVAIQDDNVRQYEISPMFRFGSIDKVRA